MALAAAQDVRAGLVNPSFEYGLAPGTELDFNDASIAPSGGWFTTESDHQIEVWGSGFLGVPAFNGSNFVELNANAVGTLFQNITGASTGQVLDFQFAHRGRAGLDTMQLNITDLNTGQSLFSQQYSDGNTAWGFYTGSFTLPSGVASTDSLRFAYSSISSAGGNPTVGNFLDDAGFGLSINSPPPGGASTVVPEPVDQAVPLFLAAFGVVYFSRRPGMRGRVQG